MESEEEEMKRLLTDSIFVLLFPIYCLAGDLVITLAHSLPFVTFSLL